MDEQLDAFNDVDWSSFPGPTFKDREGRVHKLYDPKEVPHALRKLTEVATEEQARKASSRLLFAIGNDSVGSLYPAALAAIPFVVAIARRTEFLWPSYAAISVLIDIVACFSPEPGYDVFVRPDGTTVRVMDVVLAAIRDAENDLRLLFVDDSLPQELRKYLDELLWLLEEE